MEFLKKFFGKLAGSAVWNWIAGARIWLIAGLITALFAGFLYYVYTAEKAKGRVPLLETRLEYVQQEWKALLVTVEQNEIALKICLAANADNKIALERQREQVNQSTMTIKLLQAESRHTAEDIRNEGDKLRGKDTVCRTVDESLPDWFIVGLWE